VGTHGAWAAAWRLGTPPCAHVALGLLPKAHMWHFDPVSVLGTLMHTRGAWIAYLGAWHTPAHTWCLGSSRPNYS